MTLDELKLVREVLNLFDGSITAAALDNEDEDKFNKTKDLIKREIKLKELETYDGIMGKK